MTVPTPVAISRDVLALRRLVREGKLNEALAYGSEHLGGSDADPEALRFVSVAAARSSQPKLAIEYAKRAAAESPAGSAMYHLHLANTAYNQGDLVLALPAAQAALLAAPDAADILLRLAAIAERQEQMVEAEAYAKRAAAATTASIKHVIAGIADAAEWQVPAGAGDAGHRGAPVRLSRRGTHPRGLDPANASQAQSGQANPAEPQAWAETKASLTAGLRT